MPDIQLTEPLSGPLTWPDSGYPFGGYTVDFISSPINLLPLGFSLTRADPGTYYDSAGLLQTASANAARGTYRWNGSAWVFDGTIIEAAATNLQPRSNNLSNAAWARAGTGTTAQNATGLDGTTSAWTLTDTDAATSSSWTIVTPTLTAATYTLFWYVQKTTGAQSSYPAIYIYDPVDKVAVATIDTSNGVATAWTSYTAGPYGIAPGLTAVCVSFSATKWLVMISFTATANAWTSGIIPACTANPTKSSGSVVDEVALTGSVVIERGMLLLGNIGRDASYIDNDTNTSTSRSADVLTAPTSGLLVNAQGFAAIGYRAIAATPTAGDIVSTFNVTGGIPIRTISNTLQLFDSVTNRDFGLSLPNTPGTVYKAATTWAGVSCNGAVNGAIGSAQTFSGTLNLNTTLRIGDDIPTPTFPVSMVLQSLRLGLNFADPVTLANPF